MFSFYCKILLSYVVYVSLSFRVLALLSKNASNCYRGWPFDLMFDKKVVLLGDSQTFQLFYSMNRMLQTWKLGNATRVHSVKSMQNRCSFCKYLDIKCVSPSEWKRPQVAGVGPTEYGLKNPLCTDCTGCTAELLSYRFDLNGQSKELLLEYLPVEFAQDQIIQTPNILTTQENIVTYFKKSPPDYIIVNTGLHDIPYLSPEAYRHSLTLYLGQLTSALKNTRFIWIDNSLVNSPSFKTPLPSKYVRKYDTIPYYNMMANEVVAGFPHFIDTIDPTPQIVVNREFKNYYQDTHHFKQSSTYYTSLASNVLYSICATHTP